MHEMAKSRASGVTAVVGEVQGSPRASPRGFALQQKLAKAHAHANTTSVGALAASFTLTNRLGRATGAGMVSHGKLGEDAAAGAAEVTGSASQLPHLPR